MGVRWIFVRDEEYSFVFSLMKLMSDLSCIFIDNQCICGVDSFV